MKRFIAAWVFCLASLPAFGITIEKWEHQSTLALGEQTFMPTRMRILGDDGQPLAGVAYAFIIDSFCGFFPFGATGSNGVTDSQGFAISEQFTARELTPACEMLFGTNTDAGTVFMSTFIFAPEDVVLTANPAAVDWFINRYFTMSFQGHVGGTPVFLPGATVQITVAPNGATARLEEFVLPFDGRPAPLSFFTNARQGRYDIRVTYRSKVLVIPVEQRKHL